VYNSLQDFYTDANDYLAHPNRTVSPVTLRSFQVRYNNIPGQVKPVQPLDVYYWGAYAQDEYQATKDLKLTLGLRFDIPSFGATGFDNANADALTFRDQNGNPVQYNSAKLPDAKILFSRVSDLTGMSLATVRLRYAGVPAYSPENRRMSGFPIKSAIPAF